MIWVRALGEPSRQFYADAAALAWMDAGQSRLALLVGVGVLRASAAGEAANVDVTLRNDSGQAARLFAAPPLGARVEIHDADALVFAGTLASVSLDGDCTLRVEA